MTKCRSTCRELAIVFVAALLLRWGYVASVYAVMGDKGLIGDDSSSYIEAGRIFAERLIGLTGFDLLGHNAVIMPLGTWLLAASAAVGGASMPLAYVLLQGAIDAATCVMIYAIAATFSQRLALLAGLLAAINPTQIVLAGLVYLDTPFVFCLSVALLGIFRWLRAPSWTAAMLVVGGLASAALIRVLIVPFVLVIPVLMLAIAWWTGRASRSAVMQSCAVLVVFCVSIAPVPIRNAVVHGHFALTPQSGMHLARWIVPIVWEMRDGTPWVAGYEKMEKLADGARYDNVFELSDRYARVAKQELSKVEPSVIAKAWVLGAVINLASPAVIIAPPVQTLPRTGFYRTVGETPFAKIWNFLFHSESAAYSKILLLGAAGVAIMRLLQLLGLVSLWRHSAHRPALLVSMAWLGFVLLINGPIASPKYRLPMEPILVVFAAAGVDALRRLRRRPAADAA